jgi:glucan 1,3-beta-glucosidase
MPKLILPGKVESPHWSYQLGLQEGWLPSDPRSGAGTCAKQGIVSPLGRSLSGYQTGGPGAGTFLEAQVASYGQWPPSSMSGVTIMSGLPVYVQTGTPITLTAPTPTSYPPSYSPTGTISVGNGWANPNDTVSAYVPIAGCNYPNPWNATNSPYPQCTPSLQKKRKRNVEASTTTSSPLSTITPKPRL